MEPVWLKVDDVIGWLRTNSTASAPSTALATRCAAAVEPQVQRARPDQYVVDDAGEKVFTPDAEVYQAGVQLAARLVRRRNSPSGVESFAESVSYVARYDPDIERALRQGSWQMPAVG
jgi:hypothetical protein